MTLRVNGAASLTAGAAKIDITPPIEVGILMSSVEGKWAPFVGVRKPLFARALVLEETPADDLSSSAQRIAIVSLDLLCLSGKALGGFQSFKSRIAEMSGGVVTAERIVLACTHTHTAPESGAITDLYQTKPFQNWARELADLIGQAIASAAAALAPCSLSYGTLPAPGLGIHRRVKTTAGIMMSHPEPPQDTILSREGAVDDSVNILCLRNHRGEMASVVINATCHPVYEMCNPVISPDYPGELCERLEAEYPTTTALFLNGAAGNINPQGVSAGHAAAAKHADRLQAVVKHALSIAETDANPVVALKRCSFRLPTRLPDGRNCGNEITAEAVAVRLGRAALVFLPGEPFVETGNCLKEHSPFAFTGVVGFSEETVGYIPTDQAFAEGGYEIGFGSWSHLSPGSEGIVRHEAIELLKELESAPTAGANSARRLQASAAESVALAGVTVSSTIHPGGDDA